MDGENDVDADGSAVMDCEADGLGDGSGDVDNDLVLVALAVAGGVRDRVSVGKPEVDADALFDADIVTERKAEGEADATAEGTPSDAALSAVKLSEDGMAQEASVLVLSTYTTNRTSIPFAACVAAAFSNEME